MKICKRKIIAIYTIILMLFLSSCVPYTNNEFNPYEHIGTRWICQELDLYFDVNEVMINYTNQEMYDSPQRDIWCSGELKINGEKFFIQIVFDRFEINMYCRPDNRVTASKDEYIIMQATKNRYRNGLLQIGTKDAEFFSPLQYEGEYLSFEQYDIPDGERPYTLPTVIDP